MGDTLELRDHSQPCEHWPPVWVDNSYGGIEIGAYRFEGYEPWECTHDDCPGGRKVTLRPPVITLADMRKTIDLALEFYNEDIHHGDLVGWIAECVLRDIGHDHQSLYEIGEASDEEEDKPRSNIATRHSYLPTRAELEDVDGYVQAVVEERRVILDDEIVEEEASDDKRP